MQFLDALRQKYPQLINAGLEQRVELYRNALTMNRLGQGIHRENGA